MEDLRLTDSYWPKIIGESIVEDIPIRCNRGCCINRGYMVYSNGIICRWSCDSDFPTGITEFEQTITEEMNKITLIEYRGWYPDGTKKEHHFKKKFSFEKEVFDGLYRSWRQDGSLKRAAMYENGECIWENNYYDVNYWVKKTHYEKLTKHENLISYIYVCGSDDDENEIIFHLNM